MSSMTNREEIWCEFGCEVKIYYVTIKFSDGLMIPIPRNVETDEIHNCPNLDPVDGGNFFPEDYDVQMEMADEQGGHFWDVEELGEHYLGIYENLQGFDGFEFKIHQKILKNTNQMQ